MKFKKVLAGFLATAMIVTGGGFSNLGQLQAETVYAAEVAKKTAYTATIENNIAVLDFVKNVTFVNGDTVEVNGAITTTNGNYAFTFDVGDYTDIVKATDADGNIADGATDDPSVKAKKRSTGVYVDDTTATIYVGSDAAAKREHTNVILAKAGTGKKETITIDYSNVKFQISSAYLNINSGLSVGKTGSYPAYYKDVSGDATPVVGLTGETLFGSKAQAAFANETADKELTVFGEWEIDPASALNKNNITVFSADTIRQISETQYRIKEISGANRVGGDPAVLTIEGTGALYTGTLSARFEVVKTKGINYADIAWPSLPTLHFGQWVTNNESNVARQAGATEGAVTLQNGTSLMDASSNLTADLNNISKNSQASFGEYIVIKGDNVSKDNYMEKEGYTPYSVTVRFIYYKNARPESKNYLGQYAANDAKYAGRYYLDHEYNDVNVRQGLIFVSYSTTTGAYAQYDAARKASGTVGDKNYAATAEDAVQYYTRIPDIITANNNININKAVTTGTNTYTVFNNGKALFGSTARDVIYALNNEALNDQTYVKYYLTVKTSGDEIIVDSKKDKNSLDTVLPSGQTLTFIVTAEARKDNLADCYEIRMFGKDGKLADEISDSFQIKIAELSVLDPNQSTLTASKQTDINKLFDTSITENAGIYGAAKGTIDKGYTPELEVKAHIGNFRTDNKHYDSYIHYDYEWYLDAKSLNTTGSKITGEELTITKQNYTVKLTVKEINETNAEFKKLDPNEKAALKNLVGKSDTLEVPVRGTRLIAKEMSKPLNPLVYESTADSAGNEDRMVKAVFDATNVTRSRDSIQTVNIFYREIKTEGTKRTANKMADEEVAAKFTANENGLVTTSGEVYTGKKPGDYYYYITAKTVAGDELTMGCSMDPSTRIPTGEQMKVTISRGILYLDVAGIGLIRNTSTSAGSKNESVPYGTSNDDIAKLLSYSGLTSSVQSAANNATDYAAANTARDQVEKIKKLIDAGDITIKAASAGTSPVGSYMTTIKNKDGKELSTASSNAQGTALTFKITSDYYTFKDVNENDLKDGTDFSTFYLGRVDITPAELTINVNDTVAIKEGTELKITGNAETSDLRTKSGKKTISPYTIGTDEGIIGLEADTKNQIYYNALITAINTELKSADAISNLSNYSIYREKDVDSTTGYPKGSNAGDTYNVVKLGTLANTAFTAKLPIGNYTIVFDKAKDLVGQKFTNYTISRVSTGSFKIVEKDSTSNEDIQWVPYTGYEYLGSDYYYTDETKTIPYFTDSFRLRDDEQELVILKIGQAYKFKTTEPDQVKEVKSNDEAVATATWDAANQNGIITGVKHGIAVVTIYGKNNQNLTINVNVENEEYKEFELPEENQTITLDTRTNPTYQLNPTGTSTKVYASKDESIAKVSTTGEISAVADGSTEITVTADAITKTVKVVVKTAKTAEELQAELDKANEDAQKTASANAEAIQKANEEAQKQIDEANQKAQEAQKTASAEAQKAAEAQAQAEKDAADAKAQAEAAKAQAEQAAKDAEAAKEAQAQAEKDAEAAKEAQAQAEKDAADAQKAADEAKENADQKVEDAVQEQKDADAAAVSEAEKKAEDAQKAADEAKAAQEKADAAQKAAQEKADAAQKAAQDALDAKAKAEAAQKAAESKDTFKKGDVFTVGKHYYKITSVKNKKVKFMGTNSKAKSITIPATVKNSRNGVTYKVTTVKANAMKSNTTVTKITIGKNVTKINGSAFRNCTNLKSVTIGKGVTTISTNVFRGCSKLTKVTIKSTKLKTVRAKAFKIAKKAKVTVPSGKAKSYKKLLKSAGLPSTATVK